MLEVGDDSNDVGNNKAPTISDGSAQKADQALDLTGYNIEENAILDSGKKDDDGRLVECSKCHKPYKSLPRLRNHTVKCNIEWDRLEKNYNYEPAFNSVQTKISTVIQTSVNHSMNVARHKLKQGPPPLIRMVQPNNLDAVETSAVLSQPGYLHRKSMLRKESPMTNLTDREMGTSVLGHSQEVNRSSHLYTNAPQGSPYQQRPLTFPSKQSQTFVSNGKYQETVTETQHSVNGPVQQSGSMHSDPSSNAQSGQDTTDNSIRRSTERQHAHHHFSPSDKNNETMKDSIVGRMKKSEGKWGKIKSKFRKRALLAEQRRIKKLLTVQTGAKPFGCNICKRSFSKMLRAKRHVMTHLGVRPFKCTVCSKSFNQAQALKDHAKFHKSQESKQRETYSEKKRLNSLQNGLENITAIELEEVPEETEKIIQAQIEEAGKPYKCGTCPMQFSKYPELEKHIAEHRAQIPSQPYKCGTCPMQFLKYIELEKHIAEHRARNPIQCNVCSRSLISREMLDQHLRWHREREHFFPCDQCPKTFYHLEGLKEHVAQCHKTDSEKSPFQSKPQPNEPSNVSSSTSTQGNQPCFHENGHVGSLHLSQGMSAQAAKFYFPNSPFMPTYYENVDSMSPTYGSKRPNDGEEPTLQRQQISFKLQKIQMNASSMIEIKAKAPRRYFKCSICTSTFYKDSEFNKHMLEHEEGMTFTCMACDITFSTSSELNRHYATHPGVRPYKCTVCGKAFIQATHLKFHMRRHTGEKPFQCNVCYKRFPRHAHLQEHMYLHTGEKLHRCTVCDKRFTQPTGLRSHMKRTHPDHIKPTHKCPHCPVSFESKQGRSMHILHVHREEDVVSSTSTSTSTMTDDSNDSNKTDKDQRLNEDLSKGQNFKQIIALPVKMMADKIVVFYEDKLLMEWTYDSTTA